MLGQILRFIEDNSAQIKGVLAHRTFLVLVLTYNQRVFDLSCLSNGECMLVISELSRIKGLRRKSENSRRLNL